MTWGLSMALHEQSVLDPRFGHVVNHDLTGYHVATNADVGTIELDWLDEQDLYFNPMGSKGIGELGIVGTAAAIANADHHATGVRVRDLPITLDKLVPCVAPGTALAPSSLHHTGEDGSPARFPESSLQSPVRRRAVSPPSRIVDASQVNAAGAHRTEPGIDADSRTVPAPTMRHQGAVTSPDPARRVAIPGVAIFPPRVASRDARSFPSLQTGVVRPRSTPPADVGSHGGQPHGLNDGGQCRVSMAGADRCHTPGIAI
jgi:hypothetical protein